MWIGQHVFSMTDVRRAAFLKTRRGARVWHPRRSMKKTKQCPKCESRRVGHITYQPDADGGRTAWRLVGRPRYPDSVKLDAAQLGVLEAYVCTECGYYESYVKDVDSVRWSELSGFRLVNPEPDKEGPYR